MPRRRVPRSENREAVDAADQEYEEDDEERREDATPEDAQWEEEELAEEDEDEEDEEDEDEEEVEDEDEEDEDNGTAPAPKPSSRFAWFRRPQVETDTQPSDPMEDVNNVIEEWEDHYIAWLLELVRRKSISPPPESEGYEEGVEAAEEIASILRSIGGSAKVKPIWRDGKGEKQTKLAPVVFGDVGDQRDDTKPTLLVYSHYDVPAAHIFDEDHDLWTEDPFELVSDENRLRGRGVSTKGALVAWLAAVHAYRLERGDLPVRIKFLLEGMKEAGSEGLPELIGKEAKDGFLDDIDFVCIAGFQWIHPEQPTLITSLRGACMFDLTLSSGGAHSVLDGDLFRGTVNEPLSDLVQLLSSLTDERGDLAVQGCSETKKLKPDVRQTLSKIELNVREEKELLGVKKLKSERRKTDLLVRKTLGTQISIHAVDAAGMITAPVRTIPRSAEARFSVRFPPTMKVDQVENSITRHLRREMQKSGSRSKLHVRCERHPPFQTETGGLAYRAGQDAVKRVFAVDPELVPDGNSSVVAALLKRTTRAETLVLPLGLPTDAPFTANENIDRSHFMDSITLVACFMEELGAQTAEAKWTPKRFTKQYMSTHRSLARLVKLWGGFN